MLCIVDYSSIDSEENSSTYEVEYIASIAKSRLD
jgi:hypothetical protein